MSNCTWFYDNVLDLLPHIALPFKLNSMILLYKLLYVTQSSGMRNTEKIQAIVYMFLCILLFCHVNKHNSNEKSCLHRVFLFLKVQCSLLGFDHIEVCRICYTLDTICSSLQTSFKWCSKEATESRLWRRANRIAYSVYFYVITALTTIYKAHFGLGVTCNSFSLTRSHGSKCTTAVSKKMCYLDVS